MPSKNIVLIIADDLGKYIGAYGCASVDTPNIDEFTRSGIRFDQAFASTASCSGSRSTIYTGLHTHENGQYGLNIFKAHFQTFSHVDSAPKLFNQAGYLTGILGKVHVGPDEVYPWTSRIESESRDVAWVADQADAFFQRAADSSSPFFLTIGYVDPHRDVQTRGGFGNDEKYDDRVVKQTYDPATVEVPSWLPDLPEVRQELAEYYQAIHRTDQGIGFVLDSLKRRDLLDETLVIVTSDNGPPFINAKTTLYDAGTCLPLIIKCPGRKGGVANPNMISYIDILPTLLDYAGIQSKTGDGYLTPGAGRAPDESVAPSPPRRGRSFLPIIDCAEELAANAWQQHIFGSHTFHELQNYWPTRVMRTQRYKYHRNIAWKLDFPFASDLYASLSFEGIRQSSHPVIGRRPLEDYLSRPAEELFDVQEDPDELNNLASDPAHAETLRRMRGALEKWQLETRDLWLFRDGVSVVKVSRYLKDGLRAPNRFDMGIDLAEGSEELRLAV